MGFVVPTTSKSHRGSYFVEVAGEDLKHYNAVISHAKSISSRRLIRKIGMISAESYNILLQNMKDLFTTEPASDDAGSSEAEAINTRSIDEGLGKSKTPGSDT